MRTLAIGDIHGCAMALETLLQLVNLKPTDQLIFLGDYIDRGPNSKGVLDRLIQLRLTGQVTTLRGNHELMMLAALESRANSQFWLHCGGREALESYDFPDRNATLNDIPAKHLHFIRQNCVDWYETDNHIFVHANVQHDWPMEAQESRMLHWETFDPDTFKPHISGKTMVCGHTEQRNGVPLAILGAVCIDTWAYADGWLTCLNVDTGHYYQANDFGETREGDL